MQKDEIQLNRDEFTVFVLVYVASVNCKISPDEMDFISEHADKEVLKRVRKWFDKCNDYDCLQVIEKHKSRYCSNQKEKEELMHEIAALVNIGDDYSGMEKTCMMLLDKLLSSAP